MKHSKAELREILRRRRREFVATLDPGTRALLFLRPPRPLVEAVPPGAIVGMYAEGSQEAPASAYARWFLERGHAIALPWFAERGAVMKFRAWDPFSDEPLALGPYGIRQPAASSAELVPDLAFVPLLAFTAEGARLGQGAGHYDRWLAANPAARAIGLAWDCQLVDALPSEAHDRSLDAVITPTRLFGELNS